MPATILIIEDNPANLELMAYLLEAFLHRPLAARTGGEGLELARRERPDLIVCDIQLPDLDGYAVAAALKADPATAAIPLVAVTALAMVGDRDKVLAAGFDGYLPKPIDAENFVPCVEAFLPSDFRSVRPPAQGESPSATRADGNRATVLVVDDAPVNLSLKRSLLEPTGFAVLTANSMAQALGVARQTPPDIIVSDVQMSEGSGFDFIQAVKADPRLKDIPFIFITSTHCNEAARRKGLALGAGRFLFRPIDPQDLLSEIEACLREGRR